VNDFDLANDPCFKRLPASEKKQLKKRFESLPTSERERLKKLARRTNRLRAEIDAELKHLRPKPGSAIDLAYRLRHARELAADKRRFEELSYAERFVRNAQRLVVTKLDQMLHVAKIKNDTGFFCRLLEASKLAASGIKRKWRGAKPMAVLAIYELREKLGCNPTRRQIIDRVEQLRSTMNDPKRLTERQWERVFADPSISALLK
jgi:hypothetical protein